MAGLGKSGALLAMAALTACSGRGNDGAPPRANDPIPVEQIESFIAVPVEADLGNLATALERRLPHRLWQIDQPGQACVPSRRIDIGIATIKTPTVRCRIVGEVTRGQLRLTGAGEQITLAMPLNAVVRAEDIGGVLQRETATATAMAHAVIRIDLAQDWTPRGTIDIRYDWQDAPHIDFLGQRIEFAQAADRELRPIIARLERELPGEIGKLQVRQQIGRAWQTAFTSVSLNPENPPVWMRITPHQLRYGGYRIERGRLQLNLGLTATTETFIGQRPADPAPTPLPPLAPLQRESGRLSFFIPVIADYRQLQPVLLNALERRSRRPFDVPGLGPVRAKFEKVTLYGTTGGRIAVGVTFAAQDSEGERADGTVWFTGTPVNDAGSRRVGIAGLEITGTTDMTGGDLLLQLANAPGVDSFIAAALAQDFERDFEELLAKVRRAIAEKREGPLVIRADIDQVSTGKLRAAGQGLYLPVRLTGTAAVSLSPSG
ncbi:DUF4403 family protein [Croceibacterium ferulae]|uniref:DUF4403 family protein n=1 Tax=Croceibacterium ferulae TaxID=1854641 RepID=UPI001F4E1EF5|nr:DUF4403 family protein [Croceibacterium ferulae]